MYVHKEVFPNLFPRGCHEFVIFLDTQTQRRVERAAQPQSYRQEIVPILILVNEGLGGTLPRADWKLLASPRLQ